MQGPFGHCFGNRSGGIGIGNALLVSPPDAFQFEHHAAKRECDFLLLRILFSQVFIVFVILRIEE
jgi:hypothetical protein